MNTSGFHGWGVVNGSLSISGSFTMFGLGYSVNDLSYVGTGGQIQGQLISANVKDTIASVSLRARSPWGPACSSLGFGPP